MKDLASNSKPIQHDAWDQLLKLHVDSSGWVNYKGFIDDRLALDNYLDLLSANHPNSENWNESESLAYWINAYNAFTVKLIIDNYPTESIKKIKPGIPLINSVFDLKFFKIEGVEYSLNNIEHGIIRAKFDEPRIHFAVNCASFSCPKLSNEAFCPDKLDQQLERAASDFVNDSNKNKIQPDQVKLSRILQWYWGYFKDHYDSRIDFLNQYSTLKINEDATVGFLNYNWSLNEKIEE